MSKSLKTLFTASLLVAGASLYAVPFQAHADWIRSTTSTDIISTAKALSNDAFSKRQEEMRNVWTRKIQLARDQGMLDAQATDMVALQKAILEATAIGEGTLHWNVVPNSAGIPNSELTSQLYWTTFQEEMQQIVPPGIRVNSGMRATNKIVPGEVILTWSMPTDVGIQN